MIQIRQSDDDTTVEARLSRSELIQLKEAVEEAIVGGVGLYVQGDEDDRVYFKLIREA
jgi:hypothetical protein